MANKITILFVFLTNLTLAQWGGFNYIGAETFYTRNINISAGVSYKELRAGLFYQQARINGETTPFSQKGVILDFGLFNVDKVAYFSVGARIGNSNQNYSFFTPHGNVAWRVHRNIDIINGFSTYASRLTCTFGIRINFLHEGGGDSVHNKSRAALQQQKRNSVPQKEHFTF